MSTAGGSQADGPSCADDADDDETEEVGEAEGGEEVDDVGWAAKAGQPAGPTSRTSATSRTDPARTGGWRGPACLRWAIRLRSPSSPTTTRPYVRDGDAAR